MDAGSNNSMLVVRLMEACSRSDWRNFSVTNSIHYGDSKTSSISNQSDSINQVNLITEEYTSNKFQWSVELEHISADVARKKTHRHLSGTFYPDELPFNFHLRQHVFRYQGQRRRKGLAYFDSEAFFDHEKMFHYIDPYCDLRSGMTDGLSNPMAAWELSFPDGISPIWVCDKMRYLNRIDIARRHSRSDVLRALATNIKPLHQLTTPLLAKAFPVHKDVPIPYNTASSLSFWLSDSFARTSSVETDLWDRLASQSTERFQQDFKNDATQKISSREYPTEHFKLQTKLSSSQTLNYPGIEKQQTKAAIGSKIKGRVARFMMTKRVDDSNNKATRWLTGARLEGLDSMQAQLRSHWLLETSKKSMRLVRHQINEEYLDALRYLHRPSTVSGGIQGMRKILWQLGRPDTRYTIIVVAGSFGKSIVASKIAASLSSVGLRVGLSISSHLTSFRERIAVNGRLISKSEVVHIVNCIKKAADAFNCMPTFFEAVIIIALCHYCNQRCEFVILESGAASNSHVVNSVERIACTAICSVNKNSTERTQDTAKRYLSLIRPHSMLILGPTVSQDVALQARATTLETRVIVVGPEPNEDVDTENARIAEAVVTNLNIQIAKHRFTPGFGVRPPFRFHALTHRDRTIAAQHVHYFLQCAYNLTRGMHMQWRAIAATHPELLRDIETDNGNGIRVMNRQELKGRSEMWNTSLKCFPKYAAVESPSLLRANTSSDSGTNIDKIERLHSHAAPTTGSYSRGRSKLASREFSQEIGNSRIENDNISWTKQRDRAVQQTRLWKPQRIDDKFEGARLFLNFCTVPTEEWPIRYSDRLPFKNWISEYRHWSKMEAKEQAERIDEEQELRMQHISTIEKCAFSMSKLLSFLHFVAFKNESLYWNLPELLQLREGGSPYIRPPDWMQTEHTDMPPNLTMFGNTPSVARIFETALKARIKRDELCKHFIQTHVILPTPSAVILDIIPNEGCPLERVLRQFRQRYPSQDVRICVALDDNQPIRLLNPVVWSLNHYGTDSSQPRREIKGIHILEPEHFRSKKISSWLWELATDPTIETELKSLVASSLLAQLHWQLFMFPPVSPIPTDLFILLQTLSVQTPRDWDKPMTDSEIEKFRKQLFDNWNHESSSAHQKGGNHLSKFIHQSPTAAEKQGTRKRQRKRFRNLMLERDEVKLRFGTPIPATYGRKNKSLKEMESAVLSLKNLFNCFSKSSGMYFKPAKRLIRNQTINNNSILKHNVTMKRNFQIISVLPFSILFLMSKREFDKSFNNREFENRSGSKKYEKIRFSAKHSKGTVSDGSEESTIKPTTLRNAILWQRQKLLRSDPYDSISTVDSRIQIQYDWELQPVPLIESTINPPYLAKIKDWKFQFNRNQIQHPFYHPDLLPLLPPSMNDTMSLMKAFNVPTNICNRFMQLLPLYKKLEEKGTRLARGSRRPLTLSFPTASRSDRNQMTGIGKVDSSKDISVGRIPVVELRGKQEIKQRKYELRKKNYFKEWSNPKHTGCNRLSADDIKVIGTAEYNSLSIIQSIPIWIGKTQLRIADLAVTYGTSSRLNKKKYRKEKRPRNQQFILLTKSLINSVSVFNSTGRWIPVGKPDEISENIVALQVSSFYQILANGALKRLMIAIKYAAKTLVAKQVQYQSHKHLVRSRVEVRDNEDSDWEYTGNAMDNNSQNNATLIKERSLVDPAHFTLCEPRYIKRMATKLAPLIDHHKDMMIQLETPIRNPSVRLKRDIISIFKDFTERRERREWDNWESDSSTSWIDEKDGKIKHQERNTKKQMVLEFKRLLNNLQLNDMSKDPKEEEDIYMKSGFDFNRFSHLFRSGEIHGNHPDQILDIIQQGDLQTQLSLVFQRAAAERSVLLIIGTALMAREVFLTLGCGISRSSSEDPIITGTTRITEDGLRGLQQGKDYVTISPSSMARSSANAYLRDARHIRQENERTRQSEIIRYKEEKQFIT